MDAARSTIWTDLGAACSLVAGFLHATAAGTHSGDLTVVALFAATAVAQVCVGVALLTGPTVPNLLFAAVANGIILAAWLASRTVGLPFIDALAGREAVGVHDLTAAALGTGAVTAAVRTLVPHAPHRPTRRALWVPALVALPVLALAATGEHDDATGHDHDPGGPGSEAMSAASDPEVGADISATSGVTSDVTGTRIAGTTPSSSTERR